MNHDELENEENRRKKRRSGRMGIREGKIIATKNGK